jgi:ribulose-5-phosphate 4-epimerase/fuculose-1-phosphate aldolase
VSIRSDRGFWIKASGKSFREPWFVECDPDGKPLRDDEKPSMEASFHAVIYKHSNNTVIAHTHPVNTLKILCSDRIDEFAKNRLFPDHVVFNGGESYIIPYVAPGQALATAITNKIIEIGGCPGVFLLQNHGVICCAKSVQAAIYMTEICEKAAEVFLSSTKLKFLTAFEVDDITHSEDEHYRWRATYDH